MTPPARTTTLHTRNVPVDLKAHFKAYCARRDYTMEDAVIELLKKAVQNDMKLPGASKAIRRAMM